MAVEDLFETFTRAREDARGKPYRFEHGGVTFRGSRLAKRGPNRLVLVLRLEVPGPRRASLRIRSAKTLSDRAKRWGLLRRIPSGDAAFDEAVHLDTFAPDDAVLAVIGKQTTRRILLDLTMAGFEVILEPGKLAVQSGQGDGSLSKTQIEQGIAQLLKLHQALQGLPEDTRYRRGLLVRATLPVLPLLAFPLGFLPPFFLDRPQAIEEGVVQMLSVLFALPLSALGALVFFFACRGAPNGWGRFGLGTFSLTVALAFALPFLVPALNRRMDGSPGEWVQTRSVRVEQGAVTSSYRLFVESWRTPGNVVALRILDSQSFRFRTPGTPVSLRVHPGAFGFPWYDEIALREP